jgi:endonuclease YncB( thermonuclease family)
MSPRSRSLVVIALLCALVTPVAAQRFAGRVLEVIDGDTVVVARGRGQVKVRLFGIDAPEGTQPFGQESTAALSRLVMGKVIDVQMKDMDPFGRLVGIVSVGGIDVGEALVRAGAAWHYVEFSDSAALAEAQREARAGRRGLWQSPSPQPPWLFRDIPQRPASLLSTPNSTGPYHGNRESKVLHAPGCQHYNCKNCTVPFVTVAQAQAAGFRPHDQCVKAPQESDAR